MSDIRRIEAGQRMSQAVVADLPVPVAPRSTTSCSPPLIRLVISAIAAGWSPEGS